jgi:hypothetical protein
MKKITVLLLAVVALATACVSPSLYPFYTENDDKIAPEKLLQEVLQGQTLGSVSIADQAPPETRNDLDPKIQELIRMYNDSVGKLDYQNSIDLKNNILFIVKTAFPDQVDQVESKLLKVPERNNSFEAPERINEIQSEKDVLTHDQSGKDGLYATVDNNYRIDVRFTPGKLTVVEPNKTSVYQQEGTSGVYHFTNPRNGIAYVLEVVDGGKGLKAYKPGNSNDATMLTLKQEAAPKSEPPAAANVQEIPVLNPESLEPGLTKLFGVTKIENVKLEGQYTAEGESIPFIQLSEGGLGIYQMYGAPKPEYVYKIVKWWVQANRDGTLIMSDHPAAQAYFLIVEYDRPYQGKKFDRLQLIVQKSAKGRIYITDRSKPKN